MGKGDILSLVSDLMLSMPKEEITFEILDKRKKDIIRISNACKLLPLYAASAEARFEFYKPIAPVRKEKALVMCWVHFLDRMANAPTKAHLRGVVVLCFPIMGDILRHKDQGR